MNDAPEMIWAHQTGDNYLIALPHRTDGIPYTRTELFAAAEARAWNAAIEAAAKAYADGDDWDFFGSAYGAITALKKGGTP